MAVPKKKTSKSRRNMRRAHHHLPSIGLSNCDNCGSAKLPHHVCGACGHYNGRQVFSLKTKNSDQE